RRFGIPLVDRVLEVQAGVRAVGRKLVGANEPYFAGHFPGAPVFPGVLLCEAVAQLGAVAIADGDDLALRAGQRARFRRPVLPGDVLDVAVQVASPGRPWRIRGVVTSGESAVADIELTLDHPSGPRIHPTAVVARGAALGDGVRVGPYATIGPH